MRLAFAQRPVPGLEDRFHDVVEDRFLAGQDFDGRGHARDDRQLVALVDQGILRGPQVDAIEVLALLVLDGIGADMLDLGRKAAVDR